MMRPSRLALLAFLLAAPARADPYFQVPPGASPARGGATPKVTIVAFAAFPCPFSGRATPVMRALLAEFPSELRYVFKHHPPLLLFGDGGVLAARAAIAAGEQGKFWEMHDRLFANPRALDRADFEQHARDLGLDLGRFVAALAGASPGQLAEDEALAERLGARGTPTFFINGRLVTGARPIEDFRRIIKEELARADAALAKGVPLADLYGELTKDGLEKAPPRDPWAARAPQPSAELPFDVPVTSDDACKGAPDALVTLVAFVGFQCPFSARLWPVLQQLLSRYPGTLRVCIKHNPLRFHKDAEPAAHAAIEAQRLGNFWDYADLLFANQRALSSDELRAYASKVGLDPAAIANAMATSKHGAAMAEHRALAQRLKALGTPTAFINGRKLEGAQPLERFTAMIDEGSFRAEILVRAGVARARIYEVLRQLAAPVPKGASHP